MREKKALILLCVLKKNDVFRKKTLRETHHHPVGTSKESDKSDNIKQF